MTKLFLCFVEFDRKLDKDLIDDVQAQVEAYSFGDKIPDEVAPPPRLLDVLGYTRLGYELRLALLFPELLAVRAEHADILGVRLYATDQENGDLSEEMASRIRSEMRKYHLAGTTMTVEPLADAPVREKPRLSARDALAVAMATTQLSATKELLGSLFPHLAFEVRTEHEMSEAGQMLGCCLTSIVRGSPTPADLDRLTRLGPELSTPGVRWGGYQVA